MNGSFYSVGGTSAAAPAFAGLMALAVQKENARLGNVNPVLYTLGTKQAGGGAAVFHDITAGNNSVPGLTGYSAGAGYDLGTGLGSVDAAQLINHWSDAAVSGPSFLLGASSTAVSVTPGSSTILTINLTFSGGFSSAVGTLRQRSASGLDGNLLARNHSGWINLEHADIECKLPGIRGSFQPDSYGLGLRSYAYLADRGDDHASVHLWREPGQPNARAHGCKLCRTSDCGLGLLLDGCEP